MNRGYAKVKWLPEDIQEILPEWTLDQCTEWLYNNQKYIAEGMVEAGWDIINALIDDDETIPEEIRKV